MHETNIAFTDDATIIIPRWLLNSLLANLAIWVVCFVWFTIITGYAWVGVGLVALVAVSVWGSRWIKGFYWYPLLLLLSAVSFVLVAATGWQVILITRQYTDEMVVRPKINLIPIVAVAVVAILFILYYTTRKGKPSTLSTRPLNEDIDISFDDGQSFEQRVIELIEKKTGNLAVQDGDFVRVFKGQRLVGLVRCCNFGRAVTPEIVRTVASVGQMEGAATIYLASLGHIPEASEKAAQRLRVKVLTL